MWVKVCGTTTLRDARMAAEAGADAVGFVLVPGSKRALTAEMAAGISREMTAEFPAVERVGVFAVLDAASIVRDARAAGLTGVQLHGGGGVELARAVKGMAPELIVMAVVSWEVGVEREAARVRAEIAAMREAGVERVLLDSKVGTEMGGTGVAFAWDEAAVALAGVRDGVRLVVAGGLRPATVAEAVRVLAPWGVDAVSGVEAGPGRKSAEKVAAFVAAAREPDASLLSE